MIFKRKAKTDEVVGAAEPETGDEPGPGTETAAPAPAGRIRFGIAPRLFIAFGAVAALILLACGTALLSGRDVRQSFAVATDRSVPAMTEALILQSEAAALAAAAPRLAAAADDAERQAALTTLNRQWATLESGVRRLGGLGVAQETVDTIDGSITALAGATGSLNRAVAQRLKLGEAMVERRTAIEAAHAALLAETDKLAESASSETSIAGVATGLRLVDGMDALLDERLPALQGAAAASVSAERLARLLLQAPAADTPAREALAARFETEFAALQQTLATLPEGEWSAPLAEDLERLQALATGPRGLLAGGLAAGPDARRAEVAALADSLDALLAPLVAEQSEALASGGKESATAGSQSIRALMDQGVSKLQGILTMKAEANRMAGLMGQAMTAPDEEALKQLRSDFGSTAAQSAMALLRVDAIYQALDPARAALQALGEGEDSVFDLRSEQLAAEAAARSALGDSRAAAEQLGEQVTALVGAARADLQAANDSVTGSLGRSEVLQLAIAGACLLVSLLIAWLYVGRNLVRRLQRLAASMREIAEGDLAAEVPVSGRDEIAEMARALTVFRDGLAEAETERGRNEAEREAAQQQRRKEMLSLAEGFETSVKGVVEAVSASAGEMQSTAETMSGTAEHGSSRAAAVAEASEETSGHVQSAAAAARELANSISEISRQVAHSTSIAQQASSKAEETNSQVEGLSEAAQKIGEVVSLISEIAEQTNLLALNATIEAARAGEAGRGFAVVASEVKNLASQTAKATEEIAAQIGGMQSATGEAVGAIRSIGSVIGEMREIATSISAAVEQQGAATEEIAATMTRAADGSQTVAGNISGVTEAANETGAASAQVLSAAGELARNAETLSDQVDRFLERIRAA